MSNTGLNLKDINGDLDGYADNKNGVIIIDPNKVPVKHEDLFIYATLKARAKTKSLLTQKESDGTYLTEISFLKGLDTSVNETVGSDFLTTNWTNIGGNKLEYGTDFETFGMESIEINLNAGFIPTVVIDFIDVRGATLFEQGSCSPYAAFFHQPYPIFELTIKGFYGSPITYYLAIQKFNTSFDPQTGNYKSRAEFIGYSYAFLSDILLGYVLTAPYMESSCGILENVYREYQEYYRERGFNKEDDDKYFNPIDEETGGLTLFEFISKIDQLTNLKSGFDGVLNEIKNLDTQNFLSNISLYKTYLVSNVNQYRDNIIESLRENYKNGYRSNNDPSWFSNTLTGNDLFVIYAPIDGKTEPMIRTYFEFIIKSLELYNKQFEGQPEFYTELPTLREENGEIILDFLLYENKKNELLNKLGEKENEEKRKFTKQSNQILNRSLGFIPTIRTFFTTLIANTEVFLRNLLTTSANAEEYHNTNPKEDVDVNFYTKNWYAWPDYRVKSGNNGFVEKYPGTNPLFKDWPEVKFVEEFYKALLELKRRIDSGGEETEETFDFSQYENVPGRDNYFAINAMETTAGSKDVNNNYFNITNGTDLLKAIYDRFLVTYNFSITNEDILKDTVVYKILKSDSDTKTDRDNYRTILIPSLTKNIKNQTFTNDDLSVLGSIESWNIVSSLSDNITLLGYSVANATNLKNLIEQQDFFNNTNDEIFLSPNSIDVNGGKKIIKPNIHDMRGEDLFKINEIIGGTDKVPNLLDINKFNNDKGDIELLTKIEESPTTKYLKYGYNFGLKDREKFNKLTNLVDINEWPDYNDSNEIQLLEPSDSYILKENKINLSENNNKPLSQNIIRNFRSGGLTTISYGGDLSTNVSSFLTKTNNFSSQNSTGLFTRPTLDIYPDYYFPYRLSEFNIIYGSKTNDDYGDHSFRYHESGAVELIQSHFTPTSFRHGMRFGGFIHFTPNGGFGNPNNNEWSYETQYGDSAIIDIGFSDSGYKRKFNVDPQIYSPPCLHPSDYEFLIDGVDGVKAIIDTSRFIVKINESETFFSKSNLIDYIKRMDTLMGPSLRNGSMRYYFTERGVLGIQTPFSEKTPPEKPMPWQEFFDTFEDEVTSTAISYTIKFVGTYTTTTQGLQTDPNWETEYPTSQITKPEEFEGLQIFNTTKLGYENKYGNISNLLSLSQMNTINNGNLITESPFWRHNFPSLLSESNQYPSGVTPHYFTYYEANWALVKDVPSNENTILIGGNNYSVLEGFPIGARVDLDYWSKTSRIMKYTYSTNRESNQISSSPQLMDKRNILTNHNKQETLGHNNVINSLNLQHKFQRIKKPLTDLPNYTRWSLNGVGGPTTGPTNYNKTKVWKGSLAYLWLANHFHRPWTGMWGTSPDWHGPIETLGKSSIVASIPRASLLLLGAVLWRMRESGLFISDENSWNLPPTQNTIQTSDGKYLDPLNFPVVAKKLVNSKGEEFNTKYFGFKNPKVNLFLKEDLEKNDEEYRNNKGVRPPTVSLLGFDRLDFLTDDNKLPRKLTCFPAPDEWPALNLGMSLAKDITEVGGITNPFKNQYKIFQTFFWGRNMLMLRFRNQGLKWLLRKDKLNELSEKLEKEFKSLADKLEKENYSDSAQGKILDATKETIEKDGEEITQKVSAALQGQAFETLADDNFRRAGLDESYTKLTILQHDYSYFKDKDGLPEFNTLENGRSQSGYLRGYIPIGPELWFLPTNVKKIIIKEFEDYVGDFNNYNGGSDFDKILEEIDPLNFPYPEKYLNKENPKAFEGDIVIQTTISESGDPTLSPTQNASLNGAPVVSYSSDKAEIKEIIKGWSEETRGKDCVKCVDIPKPLKIWRENYGVRPNASSQISRKFKNLNDTKPPVPEISIYSTNIFNSEVGTKIYSNEILTEYVVAQSTPRIWWGDTKTEQTEFNFSKDSWDVWIDSLTQNISGNPDIINEFITDGLVTTSKESAADDDIKLGLYRSFKSIYDKWISSSTNDLEKPKLFYNTINSTADDGKLLIEHFSFVNRVNQDIGDKVIVNLNIITELFTNIENSLFGVVSDVLDNSNFLFLPLPSYVDLTKGITGELNSNQKELDLANMFQPVSNTVSFEKNLNRGPHYLCMYIGSTSKELNLTRYSEDCDNYISDIREYPDRFKGDSFNISNETERPEDFNDSGVVAFKVAFGSQNQNHFIGVSLDQSEFKNTNESLKATELLSQIGDPANASGFITKSQSLYEVFLNRSYSCNVEAMGNMMIQPLQYFELENVPMFVGTYLIRDVSHKISAHNMKTTFKGDRIPQTEVPIVEDLIAQFDLTADLTSSSSRTGDDSTNLNSISSTIIDTSNYPKPKLNGKYLPIVRTIIQNGGNNGEIVSNNINIQQIPKIDGINNLKLNSPNENSLITEATTTLTVMLRDWVTWMKEEGFVGYKGYYAYITSVFRDFNDQVRVKKQYGDAAAKPGTSNHGWGIAVDLQFLTKSGVLIPNTKNTPESFKISTNPSIKWLYDNSYKYGWVIPMSLRDGIPLEEHWHWEYHGTAAKCLVEKSPSVYGYTIDTNGYMLSIVKNPKDINGFEAIYNDCDSLKITEGDQNDIIEN